MNWNFLKGIRGALALALLVSPIDAIAQCANPAGAEGEITYNTTHKVVQFCNGTDWKAMLGTSSGGGSSCVSGNGTITDEWWLSYGAHWGDGTYFYVADLWDDKLKAYAWTGATDGTYIAEAPGITGEPFAVWGQGGFIFVGDDNNLRAYTFNGTAFTLVQTQNTTAQINQIWGNGTTLFIANDDYKIRAYTFNGANFTAAGTANTGRKPQDVVGAGTYIVVAESNNGSPDYNHQIEAFTYVGTTFTQRDTEGGLDGGFDSGIASDGTYFYLSGWGLAAYSFNGTTLTKIVEADNIAPAQGHTVATSDSYIYFLGGDGIHVFTFDGANFTLAGFYGLSNQYPNEIDVYNGYVFGTGSGTWVNQQAYPECGG